MNAKLINHKYVKIPMKKILLLLAIVITSVSYSQSLSGKAYYESKTTVDLNGWGGPEMSEDMKKQILERMKKYLEKSYVLTFNERESIYKEEAQLESESTIRRMGMMVNSFSPGDQYKNWETNQILEEREFFGKEFLINDTITNLTWEIEKESKQIGQYLAIKATAIKEVDANDMSMIRPRGRGRRGQVNEQKEKESTQDSVKKQKETDPWEEIEIPKQVIVTAWFTPQIPVKTGPGEFGGLPGLILEMNIDRTTLLCSKIVLNPSEELTIDVPTKGKEVSREEYNQIVAEKMKEMQENFRNSGGRRGPGGRRGF